MKIQTQQSLTADNLELNGNISNISGTDYDLSKPKELAIIDEESGQTESPENQRVYLDSTGQTNVFLHVDPPSSKEHPDCKGRDFMFIKTKHMIDGKEVLVSNLMLFYDVNNDNDISIDEFRIIVEHWNMSEADRRAAHLLIMKTWADSRGFWDKKTDSLTPEGSIEWLRKGIVAA